VSSRGENLVLVGAWLELSPTGSQFLRISGESSRKKFIDFSLLRSFFNASAIRCRSSIKGDWIMKNWGLNEKVMLGTPPGGSLGSFFWPAFVEYGCSEKKFVLANFYAGLIQERKNGYEVCKVDIEIWQL
jgi:hypothetical protein